jgi:hypothetical protein
MIVGILHLVVVKCSASKKCSISNLRKSELVWADAEVIYRNNFISLTWDDFRSYGHL